MDLSSPLGIHQHNTPLSKCPPLLTSSQPSLFQSNRPLSSPVGLGTVNHTSSRPHLPSTMRRSVRAARRGCQITITVSALDTEWRQPPLSSLLVDVDNWAAALCSVEPRPHLSRVTDRDKMAGLPWPGGHTKRRHLAQWP